MLERSNTLKGKTLDRNDTLRTSPSLGGHESLHVNKISPLSHIPEGLATTEGNPTPMGILPNGHSLNRLNMPSS